MHQSLTSGVDLKTEICSPSVYKASVIKTGIQVRHLVSWFIQGIRYQNGHTRSASCIVLIHCTRYHIRCPRSAGRSYSGDTRHAFKRCGQKVTGRGELRKLISELNNDLIEAVNGVNGPGY